ncbi:uncharacterized protein LOC107037059 [Diachasma alloeum]|uniref:uncharacterized protein LOC107037059 n=1 Tax=Diachasma alloeum TaxID=454923 RepID=UPI0007383EDE|nr:uncharacterized protein LOC107037059 [Diachasma alloeum]
MRAITTDSCVLIYIYTFLCSVFIVRGEMPPENDSLIRIPGIKLTAIEDGVTIKIDGEAFWGVGRTGSHNNDTPGGSTQKRPTILQRLGAMMMLVPLVMQLLSLPGALASIKLSLLKSLLVGKVALIVILFNLLKSLQPPEVVVVHQPPPVHYDHYYSPYEDDEGNKGWFT